jgi:hypothetical protein
MYSAGSGAIILSMAPHVQRHACTTSSGDGKTGYCTIPARAASA